MHTTPWSTEGRGDIQAISLGKDGGDYIGPKQTTKRATATSLKSLKWANIYESFIIYIYILYNAPTMTDERTLRTSGYLGEEDVAGLGVGLKGGLLDLTLLQPTTRHLARLLTSAQSR
jgi:hypothetical protein